MSVEILRARPWLGTIVEVGVTAASTDDAIAAIDSAFEEIADIHRLMSFHSPDSDLARLNRDAVDGPVRIDSRTREVVELSLAFARESDGSFDPTVAAELVEWGLLPRPDGATRTPIRGTSWRDIELLDDGRVAFSRPLWLDFGGIAKGFAVDRAVERLARLGVRDARVNAGGDLRVMGATSQIVHVRTSATSIAPALELQHGSVATSCGARELSRKGGRWIGPHVDGRRRRATGTHETVSVVARRCAVADALTKIVMADSGSAARILERHAAEACILDSRGLWRRLGE